MQSSDVYDLDTHRRATSKAMQWCHDFAAGVAGVEVPMALPAEALQAVPGGIMDHSKRLFIFNEISQFQLHQIVEFRGLMSHNYRETNRK